MKIVVVGLGKVGRALTQQLSADKHDIVVIDRNPTVVDDICNICDVRGVTGNGAMKCRPKRLKVAPIC